MVKGLSLIELLVVVAIVLTISVLSTPFFSRFLGQNLVANSTDQIVQSLRKAQFYSLMSRKSATSGWGVNYSGNTLTLYQGNTFSTRNVALDEKFSVGSGEEVWGLGEVNFAVRTGLPTVVSSTIPTPTPAPGGVVFVTTIVGPQGTTEMVTVNSQGVVSR